MHADEQKKPEKTRNQKKKIPEGSPSNNHGPWWKILMKHLF